MSFIIIGLSSNLCHTPRKSSNDLQQKGTYTQNQHKWVGREYLGVRDNFFYGTRQNIPVTSGEGVLPHKGGRSDQARAIVYQKHRSLQSRKTMYGG